MISADLTLSGAALRLDGPLLFLRRLVDAGLNEAVEVIDADGNERFGRVAAIDTQHMVVEILAPSSGLSLAESKVRFLGDVPCFGVGPGLLGRVFDGVGRPVDSGPPVPVVERRPISGLPVNPMARRLPKDFIETGITAIDLLNSLVRGQKLPIFSGNGLPHDRLVLDIARHAALLRQSNNGRESDGEFAIVFAGIGVSHDVAEHFRAELERSGALERTALFLNLASDPSTQRLLTPRFALTAAEYLAFVEGRHVLVILTDMTNYCEGLREVSASHGDLPGRKGYPGYMYSDLASIFERAGALRNHPGSLTQMPILTMPGDDITHPIPDLTGYITEGQIVLERELDRKDLYPPIAVLPSLSRLMAEGVGQGYTDPDHPALANQLYAAYARFQLARVLARVVGEDGLAPLDRVYLRFGEAFERQLLNQTDRRSLGQSEAIGWRLLATLPHTELGRLSDDQIERQIDRLQSDSSDAEAEPLG
jgi:V/A-type H+-transporting ATPase subunit B